MAEVDGQMACAAGEMELSVMMQRMLTEYCDQAPRSQQARATETRWGGRWHCALDGALMSAMEFLLPMCPTCERILPSSMLYQLIEVHEHR